MINKNISKDMYKNVFKGYNLGQLEFFSGSKKVKN